MTDPSAMAWLDDLEVAGEQLDQIRELLGIDDPSVNVADTLGRYLRLTERQNGRLRAVLAEARHTLWGIRLDSTEYQQAGPMVEVIDSVLGGDGTVSDES